jgi:hypothetical protein
MYNRGIYVAATTFQLRSILAVPVRWREVSRRETWHNDVVLSVIRLGRSSSMCGVRGLFRLGKDGYVEGSRDQEDYYSRAQ